MRPLYCSICSTSFDIEVEGVEGDIGIIPVAFCPTCKAGIHDFAQQTWDLVPRHEGEEPHKHDWTDVDSLGWRTCRDPDCNAGMPPSKEPELLKIPFDTFKEAICRGDASLGSACGHCEKCDWLRENRPASFG